MTVYSPEADERIVRELLTRREERLALAEPTRVLYIDHTAKLGGGEIALYNLIERLDRERFTPIVLLCAEGPLADKLRAVDVEVHVLPLDAGVAKTRKDSLGVGSLLRLKEVALTLGYIRRVARFIRSINPDIVHTNSLKADIIGGMAARLARVPVLWHVRDRIDADYLPRPVVHTFRWLCRVIPDYVVANSQATLETISLMRQDRCAAIYSGVDVDSKIRVVHDGISNAQEETGKARSLVSRKPAAMNQITPVIGLVGRISPWKGQHVFLRAAAKVHARYPQARFQIVGSVMFGEEAYEQEIRALASELDLDGVVEFTGFRSDVHSAIDNMDILVHASTSGEPFGQVVIEGMVSGKPVVATNGGGIPEIVVDGVTGTLVPMGEHEPMANAILALLADPEMAQVMGERGRQRVLQRFTINITARNMESVYAEMSRAQMARKQARKQVS